ncbi:hypothetical protein ACOSP7_021317 [Xanthoceras sorbifolium]
MSISSNWVKFKVKPFDGKSNFTLWQRKMKNILIQQDLYSNISGKIWKVLDKKAMSSIELHLSDEVIYNVMEEKSAKRT